ncbi:MAG TPA: hypothetical protein VF586_13730 [Pyrinomonadaceae bacterium]|jgi:hypothetical protein
MISRRSVASICLALVWAANALPAAPGARAQAPAPQGEIVASIKFDPKIHGFGFRNFGENSEFDEDLTADDMIRMFGAENVCIEGSTARDCVLYETAERWIEESLEKMNNGHCDGFSVSSLRMFVGRPFKGRKSPADFQPGATKLFDLKKSQLTSNYVSYYQTLTFLRETYEFRAQTFPLKPSEITALIAAAMESKKEFFTLEVWMKEQGKYTRGHSIVPTAVEEMGGDVYRIHVYDNNYPGQTKYVVVDAGKETWRYHTANNPAETARDYFGTAATRTLGLKRLSDRSRRRFECPFCDEDEEQETDDEEAAVRLSRGFSFLDASWAAPRPRRNEQESLTVSLSGDADLLITDPGGRRIGYDAAKQVALNEIPGALENPVLGEVLGEGGEDAEPEYYLPLDAASRKPYTVTVSGKSLGAEETASLEVVGSGFVVGFDDISVDRGETLSMTVGPDGHELSFTASADGETPSVYITTDEGADRPSYEFEIGGIALKAGKTVTVRLDPDEGVIYFKDDDGDEDKYDVRVSRTSPTGKEDVFEEFDLDIGDDNSYALNFGAWDGKGKMCFKDDDDEDGSYEDEECEEVEDEEATAKP